MHTSIVTLKNVMQLLQYQHSCQYKNILTMNRDHDFYLIAGKGAAIMWDFSAL